MIITALTNLDINFNPTFEQAIIQNVRTIITTPQGTVPLDRKFGIDSTALDEPIPIAKARLSSSIIEAIQLYEPRVRVTEVLFEEDHLNGRLLPTVRIEIIEGGGNNGIS